MELLIDGLKILMDTVALFYIRLVNQKDIKIQQKNIKII